MKPAEDRSLRGARCRPQAVLYTAVFNVEELSGRHFVHRRVFAGLDYSETLRLNCLIDGEVYARAPSTLLEISMTAFA